MHNPNAKYYKPDRTMAIPCGLAARSTFDDSYVLFRCETSFDCDMTPENSIKIHRDNIAWSTEKQSKYKNIDV